MILDLMIWMPIISGLIILLIGKNYGSLTYWLSIFSSFLVFAVSLYALSMYDSTQVGIQFELIASWIDRFNINYHLGVDGISFPLILLTTFISPTAVCITVESNLAAICSRAIVVDRFVTIFSGFFELIK